MIQYVWFYLQIYCVCYDCTYMYVHVCAKEKTHNYMYTSLLHVLYVHVHVHVPTDFRLKMSMRRPHPALLPPPPRPSPPPSTNPPSPASATTLPRLCPWLSTIETTMKMAGWPNLGPLWTTSENGVEPTCLSWQRWATCRVSQNRGREAEGFGCTG